MECISGDWQQQQQLIKQVFTWRLRAPVITKNNYAAKINPIYLICSLIKAIREIKCVAAHALCCSPDISIT